ncbi:MAG: hypothetical protein ACD_79C00551G0003 [uncultured bacterium]|nr:MAG: hypothetical protein ACD_79C00551G0003 [uncultured bacterium]
MVKDLVILLKRIQDSGYPFSVDISPIDLELEYKDFVFSKSVFLDMAAFLVTKEVLVKGKIIFSYKAECYCCLKTVESKIELNDILFTYENNGQDEIDISNEVRDEIILSLPNKIKCLENCKGICPNCKVNLNDEKCKCDDRNPNSPFSKLL